MGYLPIRLELKVRSATDDFSPCLSVGLANSITYYHSAVLAKIAEGRIDGNDVVGSVIAIAQVAEEAMGGTSGALYS